MLKQSTRWTSNSIPLFPHPNTFSYSQYVKTSPSSISHPSLQYFLKIRIGQAYGTLGHARRRTIYDDDEDDDDDYGYNEELAMLESYTQLVNDEILLVQAVVDEVQIEVIIFKGFSSCLNYRTSSNPSRSVLPAKAKIISIDRAKGPFDPSNIEHIEQGLTFNDFKTRFTRKK